MYKRFQLFNCEPSQKSRTRLQLILNAHFKFVGFKKKIYLNETKIENGSFQEMCDCTGQKG